MSKKSIPIAGLIVVALLLTTVNYVFAGNLSGFVIDPSSQSGTGYASWYFWFADDTSSQCYDTTNLKVKLNHGDSSPTVYAYNLSDCVYYYHQHTFPPVLATFTQNWWAGQGGGPWSIHLTSTVRVQ